jgi:hypothetical protein
MDGTNPQLIEVIRTVLLTGTEVSVKGIDKDTITPKDYEVRVGIVQPFLEAILCSNSKLYDVLYIY